MTERILVRLSPVFIKEFCLCFFSVEMLLLSNLFGTIAIVGFILPWAWFVMTRPRVIWRSLVVNWPILLFPALFLLSTLWSIERLWTLRAALEFTTTFCIGIIAAQRIPPRTLISALLMALLIVAGLSVLTGNYSMPTTSDEGALRGIFGSKNAFSSVMSLLLLASISVFIDKRYGIILRIMAVLGILVGPVLLYFGRSLDSIVASFLTIVMFLIIRHLWRTTVSLRLLALVFLVSVTTLSIYIVILFDLNPLNMLAMVGKDPSLTGRTYLWERAIDFVQERPLVGEGYQAFWRIGNPRAQELWLYGKVPIGSGFGFHNEYLQMLVEEGAVGLLLLIGYILIVCRRFAKASFNGLYEEQNFAVMIFMYFMLRTPLETALFSQFNIGTILFCVIWVYSKRFLLAKTSSRL
jgi:exopolysaccharide production protein ExoQ